MPTLTGKTREQIARALRERSREDLLDVIWSMATVDELKTPSEVAALEKRDKRSVVRDMKAGCYVDPVFGCGYIAFAKNSLRLSAAAINGRRAAQFVPAIATDKKERAGSEPVSSEKRYEQKADGDLHDGGPRK